ncbi:MAG TPA: hypothetical protein VHA73_00925 [Acidimicrobiales bacterium]|nr:hypothetical protein [Acidimicrobiales bacterium]
MPGLRTEYDFVLPRGFVDADGMVHREGTMRLATARDELDPLRDLRVTGPDDPLLTVIVLARVITRLGSRPSVTANDLQDLFAVDLAYLQDFYGVINFGNEAEIAELLDAQRAAQDAAIEADGRAPAEESASADLLANEDDGASAAADADVDQPVPGRRGSIEEITTGPR